MSTSDHSVTDNQEPTVHSGLGIPGAHTPACTVHHRMNLLRARRERLAEATMARAEGQVTLEGAIPLEIEGNPILELEASSDGFNLAPLHAPGRDAATRTFHCGTYDSPTLTTPSGTVFQTPSWGAKEFINPNNTARSPSPPSSPGSGIVSPTGGLAFIGPLNAPRDSAAPPQDDRLSLPSQKALMESIESGTHFHYLQPYRKDDRLSLPSQRARATEKCICPVGPFSARRPMKRRGAIASEDPLVPGVEEEWDEVDLGKDDEPEVGEDDVPELDEDDMPELEEGGKVEGGDEVEEDSEELLGAELPHPLM